MHMLASSKMSDSWRIFILAIHLKCICMTNNEYPDAAMLMPVSMKQGMCPTNYVLLREYQSSKALDQIKSADIKI